jgi:hypothetical protein
MQASLSPGAAPPSPITVGLAGARAALGTRTRTEVLSEEEIALLGAIRARGRRLTVDDAASHTGMPRGLAALGLALLEDRELRLANCSAAPC